MAATNRHVWNSFPNRNFDSVRQPPNPMVHWLSMFHSFSSIKTNVTNCWLRANPYPYIYYKQALWKEQFVILENKQVYLH